MDQNEPFDSCLSKTFVAVYKDEAEAHEKQQLIWLDYDEAKCLIVAKRSSKQESAHYLSRKSRQNLGPGGRSPHTEKKIQAPPLCCFPSSLLCAG